MIEESFFVLPENTNNIYLSSRNLKKIKVITISEINTYDLGKLYQPYYD